MPNLSLNEVATATTIENTEPKARVNNITKNISENAITVHLPPGIAAIAVG